MNLGELITSSKEDQIAILLNLLDIDASLFERIKIQWAIPTLSIIYLLKRDMELRGFDWREWEIEGLIIMTLWLTNHTDNPMELYGKPCKRSITLSSLYQVILYHVLWANQICGYPLNKFHEEGKNLEICRLFDGKLWTHVYYYMELDAKSSLSKDEEFFWRKNEYKYNSKDFSTIKDSIYRGLEYIKRNTT